MKPNNRESAYVVSRVIDNSQLPIPSGSSDSGKTTLKTPAPKVDASKLVTKKFYSLCFPITNAPLERSRVLGRSTLRNSSWNYDNYEIKNAYLEFSFSNWNSYTDAEKENIQKNMERSYIVLSQAENRDDFYKLELYLLNGSSSSKEYKLYSGYEEIKLTIQNPAQYALRRSNGRLVPIPVTIRCLVDGKGLINPSYRPILTKADVSYDNTSAGFAQSYALPEIVFRDFFTNIINRSYSLVMVNARELSRFFPNKGKPPSEDKVLSNIVSAAYYLVPNNGYPYYKKASSFSIDGTYLTIPELEYYDNIILLVDPKKAGLKAEAGVLQASLTGSVTSAVLTPFGLDYGTNSPFKINGNSYTDYLYVDTPFIGNYGVQPKLNGELSQAWSIKDLHYPYTAYVNSTITEIHNPNPFVYVSSSPSGYDTQSNINVVLWVADPPWVKQPIRGSHYITEFFDSFEEIEGYGYSTEEFGSLLPIEGFEYITNDFDSILLIEGSEYITNDFDVLLPIEGYEYITNDFDALLPIEGYEYITESFDTLLPIEGYEYVSEEFDALIPIEGYEYITESFDSIILIEGFEYITESFDALLPIEGFEYSTGEFETYYSTDGGSYNTIDYEFVLPIEGFEYITESFDALLPIEGFGYSTEEFNTYSPVEGGEYNTVYYDLVLPIKGYEYVSGEFDTYYNIEGGEYNTEEFDIIFPISGYEYSTEEFDTVSLIEGYEYSTEEFDTASLIEGYEYITEEFDTYYNLGGGEYSTEEFDIVFPILGSEYITSYFESYYGLEGGEYNTEEFDIEFPILGSEYVTSSFESLYEIEGGEYDTEEFSVNSPIIGGEYDTEEFSVSSPITGGDYNTESFTIESEFPIVLENSGEISTTSVPAGSSFDTGMQYDSNNLYIITTDDGNGNNTYYGWEADESNV